MPKVKTHSGAKKRFKITGSNKRHRLTQKAHKRKRILRNGAYSDSADIKNVKQLIPYK